MPIITSAFVGSRLNAAKSIGFAMSMYATDNDGYLPPSRSIIAKSPYLSDSTSLNDPSTGSVGFRYLLGGQNKAGEKGMDSRVTGYLDCVFGSATIYADGHVTWKDFDKNASLHTDRRNRRDDSRVSQL